MATETLEISLSEKLNRFVEERVSEGGYESPSAYIGELIRQDREQRRIEAQDRLEAMLVEAIESLDRGEGIKVTPEYWQGFRREAGERLKQQCLGAILRQSGDAPAGA